MKRDINYTLVIIATHAILAHCYKHRAITGAFPDCHYIMTVFEVPYDFAAHVLSLVDMFAAYPAAS